MTGDNGEPVSPCETNGLAYCQSFTPGHHMHHIHARRVGERPWGWRDAIVTAVDDRVVSLSYLAGDAGAVVWHHRQLTAVLRNGDPVRVHEEYHALGCPAGWFNVVIVSGLGPIPRPTDKTAWHDRMTPGVVEARTGTALPTDHLDP